MITTWPILILGTLILLVGSRFVIRSLRGRKQGVTLEDYENARAEVEEVLAESAAVRRVFAMEDLEFVRQNGSQAVQRLFRSERKTLAILWLRKTQQQLSLLMDLHLGLAGYAERPGLRLEIRLALQYYSFFVVSHFLLLMLWLRGPFETVRVITYTLDMAGNFCTVFAPLLEEVNHALLPAVRTCDRDPGGTAR
jgi:hypothetical protein